MRLGLGFEDQDRFSVWNDGTVEDGALGSLRVLWSVEEVIVKEEVPEHYLELHLISIQDSV